MTRQEEIMKNWKFNWFDGLCWTAGTGLMLVGVESIINFFFVLIGGTLLSLGITISAGTLAILVGVAVLLLIVLFALEKKEE